MNVLELAKQRKAEEAAAKALSEGSVSSGMMGSNSVQKDNLGEGDKPSSDVETFTDPAAKPLFKEPNPLLVREVVAEPELPKGPPGSFRAIRLQRMFGQNGEKIVPNDEGFYIPKNEWEFNELMIYAQQYGMVEYQGDEEAAA